MTSSKVKAQSSKLKVQDKYQIQAPRIMHCGSFMTHGTKDKQKLMRLSVEDPRFRGEFRLGSDDHAQEKFRLLGFFHAAADRIFKILLRDSLVGLAIVGPYARTGTNQLVNQAVTGWIVRNSFGESNQPLSKERYSLFQIPRMTVRRFLRVLAQHRGRFSFDFFPPDRSRWLAVRGLVVSS